MILRVIITEADIRKVTLDTRPSDVESLVWKLKESLGLDYSFSLQFQDPDFNSELCNLTDIAELPEKPTVKFIPLLELVPITTTSEILSDSNSTADTEILPHSSQERQMPWPDFFEIPNFSVDVNYRLREADLLYLKDKTHLKISKELKHEILEKISERMYSYTPYPNNAQYDSVAKALISKHPCLQEQGSSSRCSGWKNSLKYKMANYRTKRRKSGCLDVSVNAGKRGKHSAGQPANKNIKKAKKGELNYLPNLPHGLNESNLEDARKELVNEMMKRSPDGHLVRKKMDLTFSLRRKEVVESEPAIREMMDRWPALFTEDQVYMEFNRIVGKNLRLEFYDNIDRHSSRLIEIFRSKRGSIGQLLTQLSQQTKTNEPTDIRTLVLRGLPVLLGDNAADFYKTYTGSEDSLQNLDLGILFVEREGVPLPSSLHFCPASFLIVIEGEKVMDNIEDLPKAVCILFALTYALHLSYPKSMKNTFQFIQQVLLMLGHNELKPRIQTLKNQLTL
ncbi:Sterile alpha motif domain-containing protein 3 [Oryzias melastigma]|uniref:Sterile alpha motif domain-containing protein 3 n=1 Tax=Oryzias melastigma TaxID=30732 RepID=A0A834FDH2_ORYME|nr:Sterile alpha motif domain-containing protein 3 [Oryzias melastigma]